MNLKESMVYVTLIHHTQSHINQNRMIFADLSVNSAQIFMKFCKHYFSKEKLDMKISQNYRAYFES